MSTTPRDTIEHVIYAQDADEQFVKLGRSSIAATAGTPGDEGKRERAILAAEHVLKHKTQSLGTRLLVIAACEAFLLRAGSIRQEVK